MTKQLPSRFTSVPIGGSGVHIGRLGLGLRGLTRDVAANRRLLKHAAEIGIGYFDVAPSYGFGTYETQFGAALAVLGRDRVAISTKVGQLLRPPSTRRRVIHAVNEAATGGTAGVSKSVRTVKGVLGPSVYRAVRLPSSLGRNGVEVSGGAARQPWPSPSLVTACDYSYDGAMRSFEASLERLGTDHVDIVFLHDPDIHRRQAMRGAYRALEALRRSGSIGAIGVSMNDGSELVTFADQGDFDVFLMAGRYTLLDQSGATSLFPVTKARGIALIAAGVFNGGLLARPDGTDGYNWGPAPAEMRQRALQIHAICAKLGVQPKAAALQFTFANPAIASLLLGAASVHELDECIRLLEVEIPDQLWIDLTAAGFIQSGRPLPSWEFRDRRLQGEDLTPARPTTRDTGRVAIATIDRT